MTSVLPPDETRLTLKRRGALCETILNGNPEDRYAGIQTAVDGHGMSAEELASNLARYRAHGLEGLKLKNVRVLA